MERNKMKRVLASILMLSFCSFNSAVLADDRVVVTGGGSTPTEVGSLSGIDSSVSGLAGGAVITTDGSAITVAANSEISNNKATVGGAIYSEAAASGGGLLTISSGVNFSNNASTGLGGAVYIADMSASIGDGVVFSGNKAEGGAGGALVTGSYWVDGNSLIGNGTQFIKNEASTDGGAIHNSSYSSNASYSLNIGSANFDGNKANGSGGAIRNEVQSGGIASVTANGAIFTGNSAASGGAVSNTVLDGTIIDNAVFNAVNAVFSANEATTGNGGAICNDATIDVGGSFTSNSATGYGGAIYNNGNAEVQDGTSFGEVSINQDGTITVTEGSGNSANMGGALMNDAGGTMEIGKDVIFAGNSASVGGAISNTDSGSTETSLTIDNNVSFIGNTADGQGGAVHNQRSELKIGDDAKFYNNTAKGYAGGAIYSESGSGDMAASVVVGNDAEFVNNSGTLGGAVFNFNANDFDGTKDTTISIGTGALFEGNHASRNGGAVANYGGGVSVDAGATFTGNTSDGYGGAVYNSAYGNANKNELTISGNTTFKNNEAATAGGAIYTAGKTILDTTDGDITFSGNTANNAANDIYLDIDTSYEDETSAIPASVELTGTNTNTNKVSIGSGIAGVANTSITNNGTTLALESGSKNSGYDGTYTQTSGTTEVNTEFFGGTSNIEGGSLNLNNGAVIVEGSTVNMASGVTTSIAEAANVTINGTVTDNGTTTIASNANVLINGEYASANLTNSGSVTASNTTLTLGEYAQTEENASLTLDNSTLDLTTGSMTINSGTFELIGNASIAQNDIVTITDNVDLVIRYGETATIDNAGLQVGDGHIAINGDVNNFFMDDTDVIVTDNVLTQNVTVINADISGTDKNSPLTIGTDAKSVDLILSDNATTASGLEVENGSTLQLAPQNGAELILAENNVVTGTGAVLVDEIVETVKNDDGTTTDDHKGVGTVIIQSDNSGFTGTYTQNMGTVIAQSGSVFFNGNNILNDGSITIQEGAVLGGNSNAVHGGTLNIQDGGTLSGTTNTVDGGTLNLADGAILESGVSVTTNTNGGYGTVNIYNAVQGEAGTDELEGKTVLDAETAITNGALTYLNSDGSTQNITVTGGGLGLFNNTIIAGEAADNSISLVQGAGVSHLTVGDGSGVDADTINLGDETSLTYKDNAYIKQDSTVNLDGSAELNFANETTNISYNPTIVSDSVDASINKSGAGSTSIESSLANYNGSINVSGGSLDLAGDDQSAVLNLSGINVSDSTLTTDAHILVNGGGDYGQVIVDNGTLTVNNSLEAENLIDIDNGTLNILGSLGSGTDANPNSAININSSIVNVGEDIITDNIGIHDGSVVSVGGALDSKLFEASGEGTSVSIGEGLLVANATNDNASLGVKDGAAVSVAEDVSAVGNISVVNGASLSSGGSVTSMTGTVDIESSTLNVLGDLIAENSTNGTSLGVTNGSNVTIGGNVSTNENVAVDSSTLNVLGGLTTDGMIGVSNGSDFAVQGDVNFNNYFVVNGDSTAVVNGDVTGQTISIAGENSELTLNGDTTTLTGNLTLRDGVLNNFTNMTITNDMTIDNSTGVTSTPTINMQDGSVGSIIVNGNVNHNTDVNMVFDYDPRGDAMDQIVAGSYNGDSQIIITGINFVNSPDNYTFTIDGTQLIADAATGSGVANLGDSQFMANTALGKYLVTTTSGGGGVINGSLQSVNPQMYRGQVATVAQYANQLAFNNLLFDHAAIVSGQFGSSSDDEIANRYAAANPLFGPYQYSKKDGGLWFKAYGNFENISMTKGLHVDNNAYGAILGADLPVVQLKDGWKLIPTAYVAYNGGHQNYDFVSMYQNGGQIGAMATAYKGNFFTSLLAYGGGYANEMNVRNMGYGATGLADNTGNWFAGVASKSAYNFHLPKNFIIQPTAMVAYNIFGNQNYGSTFGGNLSMNSGFLNGINVAPGVNVIWNKKTFSIYGTAQMVFNIMGGVDGQAGNVTLDDVRMKHPYFEYGLGVVKNFKERLGGYVQFTIRNGGRTGIGFMGGFQYKLGK